MKALSPVQRALLFGLMLIAAAGLVYLALQGPINTSAIRDDAHAITFIVSFVVLPLVGVPLNLFLFLLGARFDPVTALLIMFSGMAVHQGFVFPAANMLLRPLIEKILTRKNITLPQMPQTRFVWPSIIFMAVPGPTYAMKNYMLSLSGIPFRAFFLISWLVQAVRGIPIVLAGETLAGRHFKFLPAVLILMGMLYALSFWLVRRRRDKIR